MAHFKAIAAMAENRVIGSGGRIPWHLPEELRWFKRMTTGCVLVMGRKTFEAIGKPLPDRDILVLSRTRSSLPGVRVIGGLDQIDVRAERRDIFICGGAQVYAQTLPLCSDLYLTLVKRSVEGDTFFPPFESLFAPGETVLECPEFRIQRFQRLPEGSETPALTG
jgi:dihydrofolate reductase